MALINFNASQVIANILTMTTAMDPAYEAIGLMMVRQTVQMDLMRVSGSISSQHFYAVVS